MPIKFIHKSSTPTNVYYIEVTRNARVSLEF